MNSFYKLLAIIAICNEKKKRMDHKSSIMSKRHGVFSLFIYAIFPSNAEKTENVSEFKLVKF